MFQLNWINPPFESVTTRDLIFFDQEQKDTCKRIAQLLDIDCFPDPRSKTYWLLKDGLWEQKEIDRIDLSQSNVFSEEVIKTFENQPSNLFFLTSNEFVLGIIHFTNYSNTEVYSILYKNFQAFELGLRKLLELNGVDSQDLMDYMRKKRNHNFSRVEKQVAKGGSAFEEVELNTLLSFVKGKHLPRDVRNHIGLNAFQMEKERYPSLGGDFIEEVCRLRNLIMHHRDATVSDIHTPHNFEEFKKFFEAVNLFKKVFFHVSDQLIKSSIELLNKMNRDKLDMLGRQSDIQIKQYFGLFR